MINSRRSCRRREIGSSSVNRRWSIRECRNGSQWWRPKEPQRDCFHRATWRCRTNTHRAAANSSNWITRTQDLIWLGPRLIKIKLGITSYRLRLVSEVKPQSSLIRLCKRCEVVTIWASFANSKLLSSKKRAKCWRRLRKSKMLKKWKWLLRRIIIYEWLRRRSERSQIRLLHRNGPKSAHKKIKR